jgi:hypothetical protein
MQIIKNSNKLTIKKLSGRYYVEAQHASTATSTSSISPSLSYFVFILLENVNITEIAFQVTSAASVSSTCKVNIYDSDPTTLLPRNKLLTDQTVAIDTTGIKSVSAILSLKAGLYYVALVRNGSSVGLSTKANNAILGSVLGLGAITPTTTNNVGTRLTTFNYSNSLPDPATQDSPNITYINSGAPLIWYRVA